MNLPVAPRRDCGYHAGMRTTLAKAAAFLLGLLAMLSCLHAPVSAEPLAHHPHDSHIQVRVASGVPCCPDKGTSGLTACGQHCAAIGQAIFQLAYLPVVSGLRFDDPPVTVTSVSHDPVAPPPRPA